jgi:hypothetical protein
MRLRLGELAKNALFSLRYKAQDNGKYPVFEISVNKEGTQATVKLAGKSVMNLAVDKWYDITVVYDQKSNNAVLYCDGNIVGKPVSCADNVGNILMLYANAMDWQVDDLRVSTINGFNCYDQFQTSAEAKLTWDDLDNKYGLRPGNITITLFANGVSTGKTAALNAAGNWKATFADLPEYSATGKKVVYTVSASADSYTSVVNGLNITMLLDLSDRKMDQTVTVVWNDQDNAEGKRPEQVTVQLYADGVLMAGKTLVIKASDGWTATFKDLPEYNSQTRVPYVYTLGVLPIAHYSASYDQGIITMLSGLTFEIGMYPGNDLAPIPD